MNDAEVHQLRARVAELEAQIASHAIELQPLAVREALMSEAERVARLGSWSWELATGAITWSVELYRILGYDRAAVVPSVEAFHAAIHADDIEEVKADGARLLDEPAAARRVVRVVHSDGTELVVELDGIVVRDKAGGVLRIVGTMHDVTQRVVLERSLLRARKMEALGRLAGGVAHDFNNLLVVIGGNALKLQGSVPSDEVGEIVKAAETAAELTAQLLAFSRRSPARRERFDVNDVVRSAAGVLRRLAGRGVELELALADVDCPVMGDGAQFEQVLLNLVVNSRDAMPDGGAVVLTTQRVSSEVVVSVADEGVGMSEELAEQVFEPLFTTKDPGFGTGLGLSTVLGVVQQFGGRVDVASELGRGTTMSVRLPAAEET